jgi:hypothetical protein
MEGRQERVEPLDRAYELSSLGGEVEAVARGDRSMQQCPLDRSLTVSLKPRVPSCAQHVWGGRNLRRPEDW